MSRRLSGGAAQDAALIERVGGLRRMLLCRDCHNVMPVSRCSEEFSEDAPSANTADNRCRDGAIGANGRWLNPPFSPYCTTISP